MAQAQSKTGNGVELERTKLSSLVQDVEITEAGPLRMFVTNAWSGTFPVCRGQ